MSPTPLRLLIVDDEPPARERLRQLCAGIPDILVVGEAGNGREALKQAGLLAPEVVLLDVRMPGMDGLEAARELAQLPLPPAIIFVTAYEQHALEAFDTAASAYLLKPVRREKLAAALARAQRPTLAQRLGNATLPEAANALAANTLAANTLAANALASTGSAAPQTPAGHITVRQQTAHGTQWHLVPLSEVLACVADQKYVTLHTSQGEFLSDYSLRELETAHGAYFLRVHRNALVAPTAVTAATRTADGGLTLTLRHAGLTIEASRRLTPEVLRRLGR
jgi:two-component system response regulator AlgR